MSRKFFSPFFLAAAIAIPLPDSTAWKQEKYSKIPQNEVSFSKEGMLVGVDASASPLMHPLWPAKKITGFRVVGEFKGLPTFPKVEGQGEVGFDDYALRVGFVIPGEKKLSGLKKIFAPKWVRNLYASVPAGAGIEGVKFFNVTQNKKQLGQVRVHPSSDLISETFFALVNSPGKFDHTFTFAEPIEAAAVWVSVDGDDTKSKFSALLARLELLE